MGPQGEHGSDDSGLPRVDVVVPDDARELDRDLQAYRRELRQQRRQAWWRRAVRPIRPPGLTMRLAAAAVLLVGVAATLMTLLVPRTTDRPSQAPLASRPSAAPGKVGGLLPDIRLAVGSERQQARELRPAVIATIPRGCDCDQAADELYQQARALSLRVYFVASRRPASELRHLVGTAGHGLAVPAQDSRGTLESAYHASGLTAILVRRDGVVTGVVRDLRPGIRLEPDLSPLGRSP